MQLVRAENVTKRSVARVVSFDEESLALVLTIGMLGYGAGSVAVTEGTSAVPQRLLTSLFGAGQLRDLGARARLDLHDRVSLLFGEEMQRFAAIISAAGAPDGRRRYRTAPGCRGARGGAMTAGGPPWPIFGDGQPEPGNGQPEPEKMAAARARQQPADPASARPAPGRRRPGRCRGGVADGTAAVG